METVQRRHDIDLGDTCRDTVSGFEGVAIARTEWLHQCERITIQPPVGNDGKLPETASFDCMALVIVKKAKAPLAARKNGGSQNDRAALRR